MKRRHSWLGCIHISLIFLMCSCGGSPDLPQGTPVELTAEDIEKVKWADDRTETSIAWLTKGNRLSSEGKKLEAIYCYHQSIKERKLIAESFFKETRPEHGKESVSALFMLANRYHEIGDMKSAKVCIDRFLELEPYDKWGKDLLKTIEGQ